MISCPSTIGDGIVVRPFRRNDQVATRRLILQGLAEHFGAIDETLNPDLDDIWTSYCDGEGLFLVAERSGEIVATAGLVREGSNAGRIVRVSVAPFCRRRGIARRIVLSLTVSAQEAGWSPLLVETNLDWIAALGLYRALGFVEYARDAESAYLSLTFRAHSL